MTLRVARIFSWLAVLALAGSFAASMLVAFGFVLGAPISLLLLALVGLAMWGMRRDTAWGLLAWILTMALVAVPFLVAGVPHSGSFTCTEHGGTVVTDHFEQPGSRGWLSLGLAHVLLAGIGLVELVPRLRRRRRRRDPRLGPPLSPPEPSGGPPTWVWGATSLAAVLLGWINWADGGPVIPLGLLTVASVAWGAVLPDRWWGGGLLLGAAVVVGEVLRYRALGWTTWRGEEAWASVVILAPAMVGAYAGVALRAAIERLRNRRSAGLVAAPVSRPAG